MLPATAVNEPEVPLSPEQITRLAGMYWNADVAAARRFEAVNGRLHLSQGEENRALTPIGSDRFVLPGGQRTYFVFGEGRVTAGPSPGNGDVFERAEAFTPTPEQLDEFAGTYRSDELDVVYRLTRVDKTLRLERLKMRAVQLQPLVADTFSSPSGVLRFSRDGSGRIDGFRLEAGRVRGLRFQKQAADP